MMRKLVPLLLACMLLLTSCSSGATGIKEGKITVNGKEVMVDEFTSASAKEDEAVIGGVKCKILYRPCTSLNCDRNSLGVLEENMTKFGKKGFAYSMYQTSKVVYHIEKKADLAYYEAFVETTEFDKTFETIGVQSVIAYLDQRLNALNFDERKSITFEDKVVLNTESYDFAVRPNEIIFPGVLRVSKGKKDMTTPITIGKVNLMSNSGLSEKFDYYQYEDILIQLSKGIVPDTVFSIKE